MQIAQVLSGYSLGEADMLRRAMGKKIKKEMDAQRARFVDGAVERGIAQGQGRRDLRPSRQVRRLRLQQEPRGGLCADRLLDRLVQGEPSGRVPRRLDDPRQGQYRQARRVPRRGAEARHQGRAAFGQRLGGRFRRARRRRRQARRSSMRSAPSRGWAKRRRRRWSKARGGKPFASLADMAAPARSAPRQQEGARKPRRGRRVRRARARPRRRLRRDRADAGDRQRERLGKGVGPERPVRRGGGRAARRSARRRGRRPRSSSASSTRSASSSRAIRSRPTTRRSKRLRAEPLGRFRPLGARRRHDRAARARACSTAPSGAPRAARRWASCSSPTRRASTRRSSSRKG